MSFDRILIQLDYEIKGDEQLAKIATTLADQDKEYSRILGKMNAYKALLQRTTDVKDRAFLTNKLKEEEKALSAVNRQYEQQVGIIQRLENELNSLNSSRRGATSQAQISSINAQIQSRQSELSRLTGSQPAGGGLGGVLGGVAIGAGISLFEGAKNAILGFASGIVETTASFEKYEAVLKNTLGAGLETKEQLAIIKDIASRTPESVQSMTESYISLVSTGLKPTSEQLVSLADLASSRGKGVQQLTEALIDAQTGEFERLKEFGVKARQEGDKVSLTFKGQTKVIQNNSEAISEYIFGLGKLQGVAGSTAVISKTLTGALSNAGDSIEQLQNNLGKSTGIIKGVVEGFGSLLNVVNSFIATPLSEEIENERAGFESLSFSILAAEQGTESRNNLIAQMRQQYPDFLEFLDLENLGNEDLAKTLSIVNGLYGQRVSVALFKENEKKALDDYNESLSNSSDQLNNLIKELRDISAASRVPFNPIDIVGAEGDASKLFTLVDKIATGPELGSRKKFAKNLVRYYIESYAEAGKAQKEFQSKSNESNEVANASEIFKLQELNKAIQISIDSNNKKIAADAKNQDAKDLLAVELKQKRINDLKLRLLREAATLDASERKKIQAEIDKLEGKEAVKKVEKKAKDTSKADAKAKENKKKKAAKDAEDAAKDAIKAAEKLKKDQDEFIDSTFKSSLEARKKQFEQLGTVEGAILASAIQKEIDESEIDKAINDKLNKAFELFAEGTPERKSAIERINNEAAQLYAGAAKAQIDTNLKAVEKSFADTFKALDEEFQRYIEGADQSEQKLLLDLQNRFNSGLVSREQYENEKTKIVRDSARERIRLQILEAEKELQILEDQVKKIGATAETTAKIDEKKTTISKLKTEDSELQNDAEQGIKSKTQLAVEGAESYLDQIKTTIGSINEIISTASDLFLKTEIEKYDRLIEASEGRLTKAKELAEIGNTEALKNELETMEKLQQQREKAVEKERKINAAIQISNAILSATYTALAIAKAVAVDPTGITTPARVIGIVASVGAGLAAVLSVFLAFKGGLSGLKDGTDFVGKDGKGKHFNTGTDDYIHRLDYGERVIPAKENERHSKSYKALKASSLTDAEVLQRLRTPSIEVSRAIVPIGVTASGGSQFNVVDTGSIVAELVKSRRINQRLETILEDLPYNIGNLINQKNKYEKR